MDALKRLFLLAAPLVILVDLIAGVLTEFLQVRIEQVMNNPQGESYLIWVFGSLSIFSYLLLGLVALSLALFFLSGRRFEELGEFVGTRFGLLAKESLRSFGKAGLWAFLFIIPGIIRFIQLSMVPFIVAFDPEYQRGEKDALRASTKIVNRSLGAVLVVEILVYFGLTFLISGAFSQWMSFAKTPLAAIVLTALHSFVFLLSLWLLYKIYLRSSIAAKGESHA